MAYTNSPTNSTYKTDQLVFDGTDLFRSGNLAIQRDCQTVNMYYERISKENERRDVCLRKRPGLTTSSYSLSKVAPTDVIRGSFYDVDQNAFYWVVGNKLYNCKPDVGTTTNLVQTINTSSGYVGFCSFLKSDNTRYVVLSDGTDLWLHDYVGGTCTRVTDPDMPTPHQPYPIYLDGYIFLVKTNTGDIYNSDLDDPFAWTSGDFITAEISSDYALRMVKAKNYMIVLGYNSVEYFYDGANATGSPLSRNDSPFRGVGLVTGLKTIGDTTYFVGQDNEQNLAVFMINSFKVERISNAVVDRTLQTITSASNAKGQLNLNQDGYSLSCDGHNFYILRTPQTTWAYDIDEKFWYEFKGSDNVGLQIEAVWGMYNGSTYMGIAGQTEMSIMNPSIFQDFGVNFKCSHTTKDYTAETTRWKMMSRCMVVADMQDYVGTSNLTLTWSDNDWGDGGSTVARQVNLFNSSPYVRTMGRFRNRSFRLDYSDNYPLRMRSLEFEINVGNT